MNLISPSEHQLLIFWVQLAVLLITARALGQLMRRIGQPGVVGELGAGVLLGPSLFGRIAPDAADWLFPHSTLQSGMLFAVAWIGILLLLIETGFETDLALIRRLGRATAWVAGGSIVVPLAVGLGVGTVLPTGFRGVEGEGAAFVLFIGAALSISSLAVAGKVLAELGVMRRDFGQVTLAAGMANDLVGWVMLGVIVGLAEGGLQALDVVITVGGIVALVVVVLVLGQPVVDRLLRGLRRRQIGVIDAASVVVGIALLAGVAAQLLGAEAVLGAFLIGIVVGRSPYQPEQVRDHLQTVTAGFLAPIFFATAGLRVDVGLLLTAEALPWAVGILVLAATAKFTGAYAGARLAGLHPFEGTLLGLGLNPRGTLEIVIATVALSLGVFNETSYSAIMMMAVLLSMAAPPLLRLVAHRWPGTSDEQARLRREEALSENVVVRSGRLLVASRGSENSIVAGQVVDLAWPSEVAVTILTVGEDRDPEGIEALEQLFSDRNVERRHFRGDDAGVVIREEAALGYVAVALGAAEDAGHTSLLSPVVDHLLAAASIPIIIVRRARDQTSRLPEAFGRALVPVAATARSRAAQEVAMNLSANIGTELLLANVVAPQKNETGGEAGPPATPTEPTETTAPPAGQTARTRRSRARWRRHRRRERARSEARPGPGDVAGAVLARAGTLADEVGARHRTLLLTGESVARTLADAAREHEADLLVVGANLRTVEDRPFLGATVEDLLELFDGTVVVVATPSGPHG